MTAKGTLIAIGRDVSPREMSNLISGTWTSPISVTGVTENNPFPLPLTEQLWFAIDSDGSANSEGNGPAARSKDGGATWDTTDPLDGAADSGVAYINTAVDGRLWAITHDWVSASFWTRTKVWYSDDDGDTWTLSFTYGSGSATTQRQGYKIMCHPNDSNIIVVQGYHIQGAARKGFTLFTTDGGASWDDNVHSGQGGEIAVLEYVRDVVLLSNGRIIIMGQYNIQSPIRWKVAYTDDYGASWTEVWSETNSNFRTFGLFVNADESEIAFIKKDSDLFDPSNELKLWLSTNGGTTFTETDLSTELLLSGRAFAASNDTIYMGDVNEKIWKLFPVSSSGIWTEITSNFQHSSTGNHYLGVVQSILTNNIFESEGGIVFSGDSADISVNIPETPDPEDTVIVFAPHSAIFRGSPSGAIRRLIKLG